MHPANQPEIVGFDSWKVPDDFEQPIPTRFERQVQLHRSRPAVVSDTWQPTYEELDYASNRLAHALLAYPGKPGDRVALLLPHDSPLIAGVLGVLKAAKIVVVLNPTDPPARLQRVLHDSQPRLILTDDGHRDLAEQIAAKSPTVIGVDECLAGGPARAPDIDIDPGDAAFLVYTSGTTSNPKGVIRSHRSIVHNAFRHSSGLSVQPEDRLSLLAALSTGSGVSFAFTAMLSGATLCPFNVAARGITGLADWMQARMITVYSSSSSLFRHLMRVIPERHRFPQVRAVRLSAEPATSADYDAFRRHFPDQCVLVHTLSSSETGNITRVRLTSDNLVGRKHLPVGQSVEDVEVLLLDEHGRPVPQGEVGEIAVRSRYLASGYWRDETLTAARFFVSGDMTTFRGGDLGRINSDGLIEFAGRKDGRLKIRGYRIEPSEVEAALRQQPGIAEAAVCGREKTNGGGQFVAYLTCHGGLQSSAANLRDALREILPLHMIPTDFIFLDSMPTSPNGKIDREKLREIVRPSSGRPVGSQPASETETLLADIWAEVFERESIGREDDFFDLGGDSLIAAVIAAKVYGKLNVEFGLLEFTNHSTLADLAVAIDGLRTAEDRRSSPHLVPVSRERPLPLSFAQERTWKFARTPEASAGYTVAKSYCIRGQLDVDIFRETLNYISGRHEILRTTFVEQNSHPVQIVNPPGPVAFAILDFQHLPDAEEQAHDFFRNQSRQPFDLARGPLMRFWLIRVGQEEYWLHRLNHHIISDNWSSKLFFRELSSVYEARLRGDDPPLPAVERLQYGDYAVWQRHALYADPRTYQQSIQWWKDFFAGEPSPPEFPFKRPEPQPDAAPGDGVISLPLDRLVAERLDDLGREQGATRFVVLLAAAVIILGEVTGQPDVVLGTYFANRSRVEQHHMLGFFVNLVTLRFRYDARWSFRRWTSVVRQTIGEVQTHAEIPYEQLCEELRNQDVLPPEVRLIFSLHESDAPVRLGQAELTRIPPGKVRMPWGITLMSKRDEHRQTCDATFDATIYEPAGVANMLGRLVWFLAVASSEPDLPLRKLIANSQTFGAIDLPVRQLVSPESRRAA